MPLTDTAIRNAKAPDKPRKLTDAQGLHLLIKPNGSKHWYLKYRFEARERKLAFGPYPDVPLAQARKFREDARTLLAAGTDPGTIKKQSKAVFPGDHDLSKPMSEMEYKRLRALSTALMLRPGKCSASACGVRCDNCLSRWRSSSDQGRYRWLP